MRSVLGTVPSVFSTPVTTSPCPAYGAHSRIRCCRERGQAVPDDAIRGHILAYNHLEVFYASYDPRYVSHPPRCQLGAFYFHFHYTKHLTAVSNHAIKNCMKSKTYTTAEAAKAVG